ncbi:MAG: hypothetical protein WBA40_18355 [Roseiarcus sp.]
MRLVCLSLLASSVLSPAVLGQTPPLVMSEAMVQSSDPGIQIYVRNKHAADMTSFSPDRTLLFIHGATYPAETSFDLPIEGVSSLARARIRSCWKRIACSFSTKSSAF